MNLKLKLTLCVLALLCINTSTAAESEHSSASTKPAFTSDRILPMDVTINGAKSGTWLFVERNGVLYVQRDAFEEWRITVNADTKAIDFKGQQYWPLSAVPGFNSTINFANQSVELLFSPQSFAATRLQGAKSKRPTVSPVLPSVFFNYDLNYSKSYLRAAPSPEDLSVLTEVGVSTGLGVLTSSASGRNLTRDTALGNKNEWLRLETTFTKDLPESNRTLRLGDSNTRAGMLGRNVYFGGVQFGTNFALTPGYVTQPLPSLTGLSAAPSTVELYINDVLRQVSNVPTGPFAIDNFPILTGSGDARIVVRDLLGRETIIQQSFFTNGQLLATGLNDWSVEAGSVRRDLGSANANYGTAFINGLWRRGIQDSLTLEGRASATSKQGLVGFGVVSALPFQLLGKAAFTGSSADNLGSGKQWLISVENQGLRFSANIEAQGASKHFRELGQNLAVSPIKLQLAGNMSYSSDNLGTLGLSFASIKQYDSSTVTTFSSNYAVRVGENSSFNLYASQANAGGTTSRAIGISLLVPLDNNRVASLYANSSSGQNDLYATLAQTPNQDNHLGWRLLAGQQQNHRREEAGAFYYGRYGTLTADVSNTSNQTALRLGANGGIAMADGNVFATQRLMNSFALVEVKDYGNVGVGIGNNMQTKTNKNGVAMIPNLAAYQSNSIRLNPQDLPVSADIESIEHDVVPAWRSAVKVNFPVRSGRGALLKIQLDDGEPAPAGAIVKIDGDNQEFYVARRGEAFVTGLQLSSTLVLSWNAQQCKVSVTLPPEILDEITRLGPLLCKGMTR
ncbi:MAG: fimbrial biogenesis outer membrane usher protein [Methylotenera sp.]|uniref:fimbria/pilus outer membrane usher protein n=1 Tax=Methylotenera sp. TaxID=2051956 RepID=UPI0018268C1C|nr:fimbria/pilus outer membrane usher protein [Methylotenera sp.]NOS98224.1 fimbrial biogenesis outer membrane usher protein [Methylotenera sp.]